MDQRFAVVAALFVSADAGAESALVVEVIDGDTLVLDDGREVRLVGLQAPKLPLGRRGFTAWPLADEAKRHLESLALGQRVQRSYGGREIDRHGRDLAHLTRDDGAWIQGEMLSTGMARVYSFADNRARVDEMLALERAARADGLGIWSHPFYAVRSPDSVSDDIGTFQIVEGRVTEAAIVRGRAYLNFGEDWRSDFTLTAAPRDRRLFDRAGIALDTFSGRWVRARGWVKEFNGPVIDLTHPEQLELLD